jgi:hypothetical protein
LVLLGILRDEKPVFSDLKQDIEVARKKIDKYHDHLDRGFVRILVDRLHLRFCDGESTLI